MAEFKADRFIHQDTDEYGQGKKVTTKILETDAKNSEYLLEETKRLDQITPITYTNTYVPFPRASTESTNTEQTEITKQEITDNKGIQYRLQAQTITKISGNNTTAHLESRTLPVQGEIRKIHAPIVTTGTTTTTTTIISPTMTITYDLLGTLEAIIGTNSGTVQEDSLLAQYHEETGISIPNSINTYTDFNTWVTETNQYVTPSFASWLHTTQKKAFYKGTNQIYLDYPAQNIINVRLNNSSTDLEYTYHPRAYLYISTLNTNPEIDTNKLHIQLQYKVASTTQNNTIILNKRIHKILITETPQDEQYTYRTEYRVPPQVLQVLRNETLLVRGIDYTYNDKTLEITINSVEADDLLTVITSPALTWENLRVVIDATREDTNSNMMVLPLQIEYTQNNGGE